MCNQYTQSFNIKEIEQFQSKLTHIISEMAHVTQQVIDTLYTDKKTILIHPAKVTGMYKRYIHLILVNILNELGDMAKTWFIDECELYVRNVC